MILACSLWIGSGWNDGASAVTLAAVACCFFAALDEPAPFIFRFFVATAISVMAAGVYLFVVLPHVHDFPMLVIMFAAPFIFVGTLIPRPQFNLATVLVAITIPDIPRVARLVRSVVLSAREEPYVEAAISVGSSLPKIMWRHLMPNTVAPLIVQGTYVCASAILTEAILSFLGAGINPETPTWGNIMAEGRAYFQIKPSLIFWPGLLLSIAILSVNLIGDAARDALDPRMKQREGSK